MTRKMEESNLTQIAYHGGFASIASAFIIESLQHIIIWLIVMLGVILCDLICGVRKSYLMGENVRFSKAVRLTLGKMVTYFAFVVMVCMIQVAAQTLFQIDLWACLLVCVIEGVSIISNILKPKGINISFVDVLKVAGKKVAKVDDADIDKVIKKSRKRNG